MKVKLLVNCEKLNPDFDATEPADELNPHTIPVHAGTEIEDMHAWLLCFPEYGSKSARAEPVDDEAKRRVAYEQKKLGRIAQTQEVLALTKEEAAVATAQGQPAGNVPADPA